MKNREFEASQGFAEACDAEDPLKNFRAQFQFPDKYPSPLYFVGNSLGLQPKKTREYVDQDLEDWGHLAIAAHFQAKTPWYSYHETLADSTARLVGALPSEVVVMNSLSVNLHLMLVSFYRPTKKRYKILMEAGAFPSDQYAVDSQVRWHGLDPKEAIVELTPRMGEWSLREEDISETIRERREDLALVLFGDVNYLTGQKFPLEALARETHAAGAIFGVDLAHGAGNLKLELHRDNVDFAVWCSYKYLNAGPGAVAGCFVHGAHAQSFDLPRLAGWWGHDKKDRFLLENKFRPMSGAEGWQVSNPPILQMAALRASMEIFDDVGMDALRDKSDRLTGYLEFLVERLPGRPFTVVTPKSRGSHLSLAVGKGGKDLVEKLHRRGVYCDFREPGMMRVAPVALYNRFIDIYRFVEILAEHGNP